MYRNTDWVGVSAAAVFLLAVLGAAYVRPFETIALLLGVILLRGGR